MTRYGNGEFVINPSGEPATGDAAVLANLALAAGEPSVVNPGDVLQITTPAGATTTIVDTEQYLPAPRRARGTVTFWDAASFAAYVNAHRDDATEVYVDAKASTITAVLNGDAPAVEDYTHPYGWGDWRAVLNLRHTVEWDRWVKASGVMMTQEQFAEFIEESLVEVRDPDGAAMLELAQTFQATTGVEFEASTLLDSGQRRLTYKETTNARAGQAGQLDVPKELTLALRPYEGSAAFAVKARFRFRITNQRLTLGIVLNRVEDVLEAAFADERTSIENSLDGVSLFNGQPAPARSR